MDIKKDIKCIRGNRMYGIEYNYDEIYKDFRKMLIDCKAPKGLYQAKLPHEDANYFVLMSERSSSKTTQLLLLTLVKCIKYKTKFAYIRRFKEQTTESVYNKLFDVINSVDYGYIEYLTNHVFNCLMVERTTKNIYFAFRDRETGKILEKAENNIGCLMSVEEYARYCSNYNVNDIHTIIFDEFSWGKLASSDEFIHFMQIIATLRREQLCMKIYMLSNTISPYNQYLKELGVSQHIIKMKKGDNAIITTALGTRVYCELLDVGMHKTTEFKASALQYFGFENEGLRSLYGGEWEIKGFRHLPHSETRKIIYTKIFLEYMGNYIRLAHFKDGRQFGVFVSAYTGKPLEDGKIYPLIPTYNSETLLCRSYQLAKKLFDVDRMGLLYFSDNETALQFYAYLEELKR